MWTDPVRLRRSNEGASTKSKRGEKSAHGIRYSLGHGDHAIATAYKGKLIARPFNVMVLTMRERVLYAMGRSRERGDCKRTETNFKSMLALLN